MFLLFFFFFFFSSRRRHTRFDCDWSSDVCSSDLTCAVITTIDRQSADIARGVDTGGAGDQGMMFGYATDETPSLMPLPIVLAHRLAERLAIVRKGGDLPWLRPDGKTQVSVVYENGRPVGVSKLV